MSNESEMTPEKKLGMNRIKRLIIHQALLLLLQWFNLWFGFGVEPKRWLWLAVYLAVVSLSQPVVSWWIYAERKGK